MSVRVITEVFRESQSELAARLVLIALADSAHDDGVTWIYQARIAEKTRLADSTVRDCIKRLEEAGEVEVRKAQRGRKRVNVYRVVVGRIRDEIVDYDRLPFTVVGGFSPPPDSGGRQEEDGRRSNTDDDRRGSAVSRARDPYGTRQEEPSEEAKASSADTEKPPKVIKVGGRNLPLDALLDECEIDAHSPRIGQAIAALNGRKGEPGICDLFWEEASRYADEHDQRDGLADLAADPERFSEALAAAVRRKAAKYRQTLRGATLTPTALRDWWLDLELQQRRQAGLSPDEIERIKV